MALKIVEHLENCKGITQQMQISIVQKNEEGWGFAAAVAAGTSSPREERDEDFP